ncbi:MAG: hypothetical protein AMXMBFR33_45720 [Candidatus Xenobia bacterium]
MSSVTDLREQARERIRRLFDYLLAVQRLNTPPCLDLEEYPFQLRLGELPEHPAVELGPLPLDPREEAEDFLLRVRRPKDVPCPPLPEALEGWVKPGWDRLDGTVTTFVRKKKGGSMVPFEADEARPEALQAWLKSRKDWEKPALAANDVNDLFDRLLEVWGRLERESETVELVVGLGVVRVKDDQGVADHPLVLQKLTLEFEAERAEFTFRETDREPGLYSALMQRFEFTPDVSQECRQILGNTEDTDPLGSLLDRLWPGVRVTAKLADLGPAKAKVQLSREPVLYLGSRSLGFSSAIEAFLEALPGLEVLPPALVRVVGFDIDLEGDIVESRGPSTRVDPLSNVDPLYTMPANPEQERVAGRLAAHGTVLVQGPPGTGKTHTIANLVGHLLAEGKSLLVTSHRTKALRVVREMISPQVRPLCVSVLDNESESHEQLEEAVKGMVNLFSSSDAEELERLANTYGERRMDIKSRLAAAEQRLVEARTAEYEPIPRLDGESIHPTRAAQEIAEGRGLHDWIQGPVPPGGSLPLSPDEITELYALNSLITPQDEHDLQGRLAPLEEVPSERRFSSDLERRKLLQEKSERFEAGLWSGSDQDLEGLRRLREAIQAALGPLADADVLQREVIRAGLAGGEHRQSWQDLVDVIKTARTEIGALERQVLAVGPTLQSDMPLAAQATACAEIVAHLRAGKSITGIELFTKGNWKKLLAGIRVGGGAPKTADDMEAVGALIAMAQKREQLKARWDRQVGRWLSMSEGTASVPTAAELGERPEDTCAQHVARVLKSLNWTETWAECKKAMAETGLRWEIVEERVPPNSAPQGDILRLRDTLKDHLEPVVEARTAWVECRLLDKQREDLLTLLDVPEQEDHGKVVARLREAVQAKDPERYGEAWNRLVVLHQQKAHKLRRDAYLERLKQKAPGWAEAVFERTPPHNQPKPPGDPEVAWQHRQWAQLLDSFAEQNLDDLQQEIMRLRQQLQDATASFVENLTWSAQLRRTGIRQQQSLIGWLDLMRKIGSGKGKRAPLLKAKARERLAECRESVPVWIMPIARVAESYKPGETLFDVVILDEASQSDLTSLIAFALGREVLVVGDHEQVSPEQVGQSAQAIESLIDRYLKDVPNSELFDGKTSVYDLARRSFGGTIRLLEHFRSVPEIIAFSNAMCYQGEVQPLRERSGVRVAPATVAHRVHVTEASKRVNHEEALEVASLLAACCEQPEYAGASMGVISMVGEEQALAIDRLLTRHLSLTEYGKRRVVCGTPAQFQGDERDVVFLSLVDTAPDGPLALRTQEMFVKRYNVAASRARNQMWVVYSMDPDTDLKEGDLRLKLIRHAQNPYVLTEKQAEQAAEPEFEFRFQETVYKHLTDQGYRVLVHHAVGTYKLDLVVEGRGGRVAVQCDGERDYPPGKLSQHIYRETVLERVGWRFVRLRASSFYRHQKASLETLVERLKTLGVEPFDSEEEARRLQAEQGIDLYERVVARAAALRRKWSGAEDEEAAADGEGETVVAGPVIEARVVEDTEEPPVAALETETPVVEVEAAAPVVEESAVEVEAAAPVAEESAVEVEAAPGAEEAEVAAPVAEESAVETEAAPGAEESAVEVEAAAPVVETEAAPVPEEAVVEAQAAPVVEEAEVEVEPVTAVPAGEPIAGETPAPEPEPVPVPAGEAEPERPGKIKFGASRLLEKKMGGEAEVAGQEPEKPRTKSWRDLRKRLKSDSEEPE